MNQKGFINILIIIALILAVGAVVYLGAGTQDKAPENKSLCLKTGCSGQVCADEEAITTCEYLPEYECYKTAKCERQINGECGWTQAPELLLCIEQARQSGETEISLQESQREGSFLLEKIYPESVSGLNFPEYPIAIDKGYPVTLRFGEMVSNGCTITLTLKRIEGDRAIFTKKTDFNRPCPICLAAGSLIDTPLGRVAVNELKAGMLVWSVDKYGNRVVRVVAKISKTPVPPTFEIARLMFADGREIFVSPGHPTNDGRAVGDLIVGEFYDGARITAAERVIYDGAFTYDILPSGETGLYWANGVLLGSTLR